MTDNVFKETTEEEKLDALVQDIKNIISIEVEKLKRTIMASPIPKRSYFDLMKNWWNNLVHGHDSSTNPYFHKNRLGALGYAENVNKKTELDILKESASILNEAAGTTKFEKMLDTWAVELKKKLSIFVTDCIKRNKCDLPEEVPDSRETESDDISPPGDIPTTTSTTTTTPVPSGSTTTTPVPSGSTTTTPVPSGSTTTTLPPPPPPSDPSLIDFELFRTSLTDKQKVQAAKDFNSYLSLSDDEKKKLNDKGNYNLGVKPVGNLNYQVDGINLELPFFVSKNDPRWKVLHDKFNNTFSILRRQRRVEAPRSGGWADGLKVALSNSLEVPESISKKPGVTKLNFSSMMNLFVQKFVELAQRNPDKYDSDYLPLIRYMIKNRDELATNTAQDDAVLQHITGILQRLPDPEAFQEIKIAIIKGIDEINFPTEETTENNSSIKGMRLNEFRKLQNNKIALAKSSTFYERTLDCLEKLRNRTFFLD